MATQAYGPNERMSMDGLQSIRKRSVSFGDVTSKLLVIAVCIAACLLSRFALADRYSSVGAYEHEIQVLDEQKVRAAELASSSVVASAWISMLKSDTGTPIAEQLAEISKDLAIVTAAILLEKYLLTIFGYAFFAWLIPLCCACFVVGTLMRESNGLKTPLLAGAFRVLIVGCILWRSIPISVFVADKINETYDVTITTAIEDAQQISSEVERSLNEEDAVEEEATGDRETGIAPLDSVIDSVSGVVGSAVDTVTSATAGKIEELIAWAKVVLTQITEGFAVMVVTSCVIPILVPLIMVWLAKTFFQPSGIGGQISMPQLPMPKLEGLPSGKE